MKPQFLSGQRLTIDASLGSSGPQISPNRSRFPGSFGHIISVSTVQVSGALGCLGLVQVPGSMSPVQDPSYMDPIQDPGCVDPVQDPSSMGPVQIPWPSAFGPIN